MKLIRIESSYSVAGVECNDMNVICRAALIVGYMKRWKLSKLVMHCIHKRWAFAVVDKEKKL